MNQEQKVEIVVMKLNEIRLRDIVQLQRDGFEGQIDKDNNCFIAIRR